jgi:hypothetical protein
MMAGMGDTLPTADPWERQPAEGARAFAAFAAYRDLPASKRSLSAACAVFYHGKTAAKLRQLESWSSLWHWTQRAAAWDDEQDRLRRQAHARALQEMAERHARDAVALQTKALARLKALDPNELSAADVLRYLVEAAKLERLARGEPETVQEQRGESRVRVTVEDLAQARRRLEEWRRERLGTGPN